MISWVAMDNMVTAYGKDHVRLRRLVGKAFTPRRTEAIRPRIEELTDDAPGRAWRAAPPGEVVDLRERFAYPLPAMLVADLIGMSEEARAETAKVIDMMVDTTVTPEQAQAMLLGWRGAMDGADRREARRARRGHHQRPDRRAGRGRLAAQRERADRHDLRDPRRGLRDHDQLLRQRHHRPAHPSRAARTGPSGRGHLGRRDRRDAARGVAAGHLPLRYAVEDIELGRRDDPQGRPDPGQLQRAWAATRPCTATTPAVRHHPGRQGAPVLRARPALLPRRAASPGWWRRSACPRCSSGSPT